MEKEYLIKEYNRNFNGDEQVNELLKEYMIRSCLLIANRADFKTDYDDVKEHIFEKDEYIKLFIVEKNKEVIPEIKGFAIFDRFVGYNEMNFLHCHGIILDPDVQGLGLSKTIINYAIKYTTPDVLTVKTHNPRCFNTFINLNNVKNYYPNKSLVIPDEILKLSKTDPFISPSDDDLIYRNAYPDVKIQQSKRNDSIDLIFNKLSPFDAQSLVLILNDDKMNTKKKVLTNGNN